LSKSRHPKGRQQGSAIGAGIAIVAIGGLALLLFGGIMALKGGGGSSTASPSASDSMSDMDFPAPQPIPAKRDLDPSATGPRIRFGTNAIDFGVVPLNMNVNYSFSYANVGVGKLNVSDVFVRVLQGC